MNRLLTAARLFNTLLPLMMVILLIALASWGLMRTVFQKKSTHINTVVVAGTSSESPKVNFRLVPSPFPENGEVVFFKLVAHNGNQSYEERWREEIRNLLVVKSNSEDAVWLFPDQSLELVRTKEWPGNDAPLKALSIQTRIAADAKNQDKVSLYVVRHDGSGLTKVLDDVDEVLGQTIYHDGLRVIYQKSGAVRAARISFKNLKTESDIPLAQIANLR